MEGSFSNTLVNRSCDKKSKIFTAKHKFVESPILSPILIFLNSNCKTVPKKFYYKSFISGCKTCYFV